tara:strand:- start:256 stop:465 length:210 start_codon:yes stop_codon:yes gene_type:complete
MKYFTAFFFWLFMTGVGLAVVMAIMNSVHLILGLSDYILFGVTVLLHATIVLLITYWTINKLKKGKFGK